MFSFYKTKIDEKKELEEKRREEIRKEAENLKIACKIFKTPNGKYFLKHLKKITGWDEKDLNIDKEILGYKRGRRDIWLILREFIPKDVLAEIEIYTN